MFSPVFLNLTFLSKTSVISFSTLPALFLTIKYYRKYQNYTTAYMSTVYFSSK